MKKIISLGLFLLFSITVSAQIVANGNSGSAMTQYTDGSPNDPIYIWCNDVLSATTGSLTATSPSGTGPFTFKWYYHNQANSSWALYTTQTGMSSTISTLPSDGYRVQIYSATNQLLSCYNAWVWNLNTEVTASNVPSGCDTTNLSGTVQTTGTFTYYNPPPPEAIITPNTQVSVTFNATHTYISDLAFYLVAPNGATVLLMPNPGVTNNPGGNVCNSNNNVVNFTLTNTSTASIDVCNPATGPLTGTYGAYAFGNPPVPTPINWTPIIGQNAAAGGWAVQIYDCIGADVGHLNNASITFTNLDITCNAPPSVTYTSGNIGASGTINDNSCSAATASIFQVPVSTSLSTPITVTAGSSGNTTSATYSWSSNGGSIANPGSLNTGVSGLPVGTTDLTLTVQIGYGTAQCQTSRTTSFTREPMVLGEPEDLIQCALDNGPYTFDLTQNNDEILAGMDPVYNEVSFYHTEYNADNGFFDGISASQASNYQSDSGDEEVIWARVTNFTTECYAITSFIIRADPAPTANSPADQQMCDDDNNGSEIFDLTQLDGDVLAGQDPDEYIVSYHNSLSGANGNANNVANPTSHTVTDGMTVYIRLTNENDVDCYSVSSVNFIVTPTPVIVTPADGFACVDQGFALPAIPVGNYFTQPGGTGIPMNAGQVLYASQTVYIYAESNTSPNNCTAEDSFNVTIYPLPVALTPGATPYVLCDDNNSPDGVEIFDLTSKANEITNDPDVTLTYYTSQGNATGEQNAIADPTAYESGSATIWVRLETSFGCASVTSFQLVVNPLPVVNNNMDPFYACEETPGQGLFDLSLIDPVVTNGASGYTVAYYDSLDDAQNNPDNYLPSPYSSATATIYAVVTDVDTGCSVITTADLEVLPAPIAPNQAPLEECDPNNDDVTVFNIDPVLAGIMAAMNNSVTLTVHETMDDAQFGTNPIPNTGNYTNVYALTTGGVQTVYILVKSAFTDCFDIVPLQLIVHPVPEATEPEPYILCDNGNNDTDGIATFDLTTKEAEIMNTMDTGLFSIAFFTSAQDAAGNVNAIPNPASYNSPSGFVYARVTNNSTGCYDVVELELIVNPLPVANNPVPYTLCDINNPGDEQEVFDLTTKIPEIIVSGGQPQSGINTTFYHTYDDAVAGTNQIDNPETYTNGAAVETIFVKVQLEATGCYRIVLLDVRVEPVPVLVTPTAEETTICDTTGLGIGVFDLDALVEDMVNGAPNVVVTFHHTLQDAIDGVNAIPNTGSYQNVNPFIEYIYVRAVNSTTECTREPYMLTLIVSPAPIAPEDLPDLVQCDETDNNNQDGQAFFDLTQQNPLIHSALGTDDTTLTIHYFTTEENANNGSPRITNPSHYFGSDEQTIWVRVETPGTECFSVTSFQLQLDKPLALTTPTMLAICNEALPNDHIAVFDLTVKDEEILGIYGVGVGNTVTYFELDPRVTADAQPIPDPTAYTNPGPPQGNPKTLYVMVTTPEGCKSYTTLTIKVLPLPVPDTNAAPLVACDDNSSPDGMEIFDLTDAAADIRNNDNYMVLTYYTTEQDAYDRVNEIPDPTNFNSGSATIWVRAEANTQDPNNPVCFQVVSFELIVNPLPELGNAGVIDPYAICEQNTDGIATFDFNTHMDEILGTAVGGDYTVKFFRDAAALANNTAIPYIYTNTSSPYQQDIIVWVRNDETGCINTAPLRLLVEEAATANPVTETFFECDYDGTNDGVFTFDLTRADDDVLGSQNPATYSVTYYTSIEDAEAGTNPIANPTAYQNVTSPDYQMIWVRVTNESTVSRCHEITTLELFVERIPEPVLTTDHTTVCINFETGANERSATIDSNLPATDTFVWYKDGVVIPGQTGPTLEVLEPGSYTVVATSPTGCVSDPIADMVIERSGSASPIGNGYVVGNAFSNNQVITVLAQGYGEYEYRLDDGPWQNSNVFENVSAGSHIVQVRDTATADPCNDLYLVLEIGDVSVIDYPNFFTPNADGFNDTWNVIGLGGEGYNAVIYIFDRYGKLIKQLSPSADSEGWDGTFNGAPLPADDYWFTVEYTEGQARKEYKAHFALKR